MAGAERVGGGSGGGGDGTDPLHFPPKFHPKITLCIRQDTKNPRTISTLKIEELMNTKNPRTNEH